MPEYIDFANQGTLPLVEPCSGTKMLLSHHQVPAVSNVPVLASHNSLSEQTISSCIIYTIVYQ